MKLSMTILLVALVMVLGCTPAPKPGDAANATAEDTTQVTVEEALGEYTTGEWIENYEDALKAAKDLDRPILVNFTGSDWCGWCKKLMSEVFSKDEFKQYAKDNLVLLKLDFPRSIPQTDELKAQNNRLQEQFKIQGYPTIVLIDAQGKEINRTGYQPGGAVSYVTHLKQLLAK